MATIYYYDNDSSTAGFGTAGGTWAAPTTGPIPGWTTSATGSIVPGSVTTTTSDPINFGNGATGLGAGTITLSGALSSSNILFAAGSGAIMLSGGASLTLPASATITVDNSSDTIATPLAGASTGLTKAGTGSLILSGANTITGTLTVNSGELQLNGGSFNLGAKAVTLTTATSTAQQAVLNLVGGSLTNSVSDSIGFGTNAVGIVKLSSGNYVKTGTGSASGFNIASGTGGKTNYGALLISGGTALLGGEFNIARDGTGASGLVSQSGGTLVCSNFATVGREGFGVFDISGGTLFRPSTALNRFFMGRTAGQFSQLTIRGAGTFNVDDAAGFYFANSATPVLAGVVNLLSGGTLISRVGITWNANVGSMGHFNFNGGTLQASGSSATYWNGLWTACYVYSGGATIDSQGNNITISQPLLVPAGSGVTSITGGTGSGYLAPPVVSISGDGTGATAIAQIDSSGNITNVFITNPGVNYSTATVTLIGGGGAASGWTAAIGANATTGGLTKLGSGALTLSGANTYQGATKIVGGTLAIAYANYPNTSALTLSNGAALNLDVTGGANSLATPSLTLGTNATLNLSYGTLGGNPFIPAIDNASATGTALTANGTNIVINISGTGFASGQFPLIKYSGGSIGGNGFAAFKLGTLPSGVPATAQLVNNTGAGTIDLSIPLVNTLTWNGTNSSWDINTTYNWKDAVSTPSTYKEYLANTYGDIVTFDDSLADPSKTNINLTTTLRPSAVNITASSTPYAFTGSGKLSGASFLNISGVGTLAISTTNDYTGGSTLGGGTVLLGNNSALGAGVVTLSGSTLSSDSSTPRTVTNSISISADTTFGTGSTSGTLTLSGPVNMGGVDRGLSHDNNVSLTGPASNGGINKSGSGTLTVDNTGTLLSGTTTVNAGKVTLNNGSFTGSFNIAPIINQTGVIEIGGGNVTNTAQNNIATAANTVGVIKQTGGNFVETGTMAFGSVNNSASAAYLMSGGFASFGGDTQLGRNGAVGLISQSGGTMQSSSFFTIARDGSLGVYDLSGGTHLRPITAANTFYLGNRSASSVAQAQVTIRNAGVLDIEDNNGLWFDRTAGRTNQLVGMVNVINGGTLISRVGIQWGNSNALSVGYVNFNNGTLSASGSSADYWSGWTAGYLYSGGVTMDSQGNTVTIGQSLQAPTGNGVASITGFSGSGFLSPPVVIISGDGTGATAVAQIDSVGNLTGITVTCPGVNYTSASVGLNGGGGSGSGGAANLAANSTTGGLTKVGVGLLTLTGTNNYGGLTTVSNGTLVLGKSHVASGNLTVSDGATLGCLSDAAGATVNLPAATVGVTSGAGLLARFTGINGNPTVPAGYITNLTLNGTVAVSVTYGGIQVGTIPLIRYATLSGSGTVTNGTLPPGVGGTVTNNTGTKTIELIVTNALPPNLWDGGGADASWGTTTNWLSDTLPTFDNTLDVNFYNVGAGQLNNYLGADRTIRSLNFTADADSNVAIYPGSDTVNNGNFVLTFDNSPSINVDVGATGTHSIGLGDTTGNHGWISLSQTLTVNHNGSGQLQFYRSITNTGGFTKNGSGTVYFRPPTSANTFSGTFTLNAGAIQCVRDTSTGTGGMVINGGKIGVGTSTSRAQNNSSYTINGDFTVDGSTGTLVFKTGTIDLAGGSRVFTINQPLTIETVVSNGGLIKAGPSTLTLTNVNTYTGPTTVSNGTLIVNGSLGGSAVAVEAGGTLGGSGTLAGTVSFLAGSSVTNDIGSPLTVSTLNMAGNANMKVATTNVLSAGSYPLLNYTSLTGSGQFTNVLVGDAGLAGGLTASVIFTNNAATLIVSTAAPQPTNIVYTVSGNQLILNWPDGQGWQLQSQTNGLNTGLTTNWTAVSGATPPFTNTIVPGNPSVFYRLKY